jgi:hypothetical protein
VEDAVDDLQAQGVRGPFGGALGGAGAEAEAEGEADVDRAEHGQPAHEVAGTAPGHGPVDDHADEDGDQRLTGLVPGAQERSERHVPPLPGDGPPQDALTTHQRLRSRPRTSRSGKLREG